MAKNFGKIAHVLPWANIGGTELATLKIATGVEDAGFESIAFCARRSDNLSVSDLFRQNGFSTEMYDPIELSFRNPAPFLRESWRFARTFKRMNISLIHCADLLAASHSALAGRIAGIPLLCHVRCTFREVPSSARLLLNCVNHFAFVSKDAWQNFGYKVSSDRGIVIYDGIERRPDERSDNRSYIRGRYGIPNDACVIGMVARVAPQKDFLTLAEAAEQVIKSNSNVRFLIVGECSGVYAAYFNRIQRILESKNLSPYFIFTDFQADVDAFIQGMDLFVLSTNNEGLPLVILEAMAHGIPVIATAVDGIPEIIQHERTGLLHAPKDSAALSKQICALMHNEPLRTALAKEAYNSLERFWTTQRFVNDMVDLYTKMIPAFSPNRSITI